MAFRAPASTVRDTGEAVALHGGRQLLRDVLPTARKWRTRFAADRLDGLTDEPRPGVPRTITDAQVEQALARTLETEPTAATHGSTRTPARELGLSQTAVARIGRAFGLKPHRHETFELSTDPFVTEKVQDVVGLDMAPPDKAVVVCLNETSKQLVGETRTPSHRPRSAAADRLRVRAARPTRSCGSSRSPGGGMWR